MIYMVTECIKAEQGFSIPSIPTEAPAIVAPRSYSFAPYNVNACLPGTGTDFEKAALAALILLSVTG